MIKLNRLGVIVCAAALFLSKSLRADTPELPTYTYAISTPSHEEAGVFVHGIHLRLPDTIWTCDITYGHAGLLMRCGTPRLEGGLLPEVITRVSCASSDTDAATVHLSTLDAGVYASMNISCKRNLFDDGF